MRRRTLRWIEAYTRRGSRRQAWKKVVQTMACIVVFCTTYALILPAITMEQQYTCGLQAHEHSEGCYTQQVLTETNCSVAQLGIHQHSETCLDESSQPLCGYQDFVLHTHDAQCFGPENALVCPLEEIPAHTHSEACQNGTELSCTLREAQPHVHMDTCLDDSGNLVCGQLELHCHQHSEGCIVVLSQETQLTCTQEVHTHSTACTANPEADVETAEQWETILNQVTLTGEWRDDLLTIAKTQLGYEESSLNYLCEDGETKQGYTRYGAWYGTPYADWNAMFASFCLHYAGIPQEAIPYEADNVLWANQLLELSVLETPDVHSPLPGELVFYGMYHATAVQSGIVCGVDTETDPETGEIRTAQLRIIAGDAENRVAELSIPSTDILGICDMTKVRQRYDALYPPAAETQSVAETTAATEPVETTEATQPSATVSVTEPAAAEETAPVETTTATEATEPPEIPEIVTQQAETENYIVTVSYPANLVLPEGAQLQVTEYPKDSDIFRQRCEEAGYELEWLMNIGFFLDDQELNLDGAFDVLVTSKQGTEMGEDITHFADDGAERITGASIVEDGQTAVSFCADSFSDFGGGVAATAETDTSYEVMAAAASGALSYSFTTVNPAQLQEGVDYAVYTGTNNNFTFLSGSPGRINVNNTAYWSSPYTIGGSWELSASQMSTDAPNDFTWRVVKNGNQYYLVSQRTGTRLAVNTSSVRLTENGTALTNTVSGAGTTIRGSGYLRYNNSSWTGSSRYSTTVYFAQVTPNYPNYPHAVHTGEVDINRLRFYNICDNGENGVSALAGCVFEIRDANGNTFTVTSGDSPEVNLPADIDDGVYTITEISAPDGYMRDTDFERTFTVKDGKLDSKNNIGTFINHNLEQLTSGKTAEVEDYNNRIYQVLLNAESNMRLYQMDPIDVLFVVDQSNSMLFPSGMVDTGKQVTLRLDGTNNAANLDALNLDKSKMHYLIADASLTSTVYCIWHDGTAWLYQDASYYAKAKHGNAGGYQTPNETAIFPSDLSYNDQKASEASGTRSNGGGIGKSIAGCKLGDDIASTANDTKTFTLYTSTDEYNRLHYLEEALANMIYELADVNDENRVTLTGFTKEVSTDDCIGPLELSPENADRLVAAVTDIHTSGGTRQDIALKHIYEQHFKDEGKHYDNDAQHTYTILITDGAPVLSGGSTLKNLGEPEDPPTTTGDTVYGQIQGYAKEVRNYSTLMTVGLGLDNVKGGKKVLEKIASSGEYYCALDNAADLVKTIQELLFESFRPKETVNVSGDVVDEISDSFYPIAWVGSGAGAASGRRVLVQDASRDWVLLNAGDWITLDGKLTAAGAADAAGQLLQKDDGTFYVQWLNQPFNHGNGWNGTFYVKAKEDFIGGNAIDTNKNASVVTNLATKRFETPTVNVRLLDMNEQSSEVTVYLGDIINENGHSPLESLIEFYQKTRIKKLVSGDGDVLNKQVIRETTGLEESVFDLIYAMGRNLTADESRRLVEGYPVTVEYIYDLDSSHGPVGYFTFQLEKTGATSNYDEHTATAACQPGGTPSSSDCTEPAETYTLRILYTAYGLNEEGRPEENVHNGTGSPGTEVGTGRTLETGLGVVEKENIHEVHVISGSIEITKKFDGTLTADTDHTFSFTLHRQEDGEDTSRDVTKTITIPANSSAGQSSIVFDDLARGTYTVTEALDETYTVKEITVLNTTNCFSTPAIGESGMEVTFVMGSNTANENVITKPEGGAYTSYTDPVNGVYGAAEFTNKEIVYYGEVPVVKNWDDGAESHSGDVVYLVLYKDGTPLLDGDGRAKLLKLDPSSSWQDVFTVVLAHKNDKVTSYNYSVREVSQVSAESLHLWQAAVLENDGSILYYEKVIEQDGLVTVGGNGYIVQYEAGENGAWTVTNLKSVTLPETGGMGTHMYTFSGLLVMMAALMYGYSLRRKRERGASS